MIEQRDGDGSSGSPSARTPPLQQFPRLPPSISLDDLPPRFRRFPSAMLVGTVDAGARAPPAAPAIEIPRRPTTPALPWGRLAAFTRAIGRRLLRAPVLAFCGVAGYFGLRSFLQVVPEGDSTLHLQLMELVANGHLPKTLPYFAAVVGQGGEIKAYFPYSYPLLYHLIGGGVFKIGGERLAMLIGPACAGLSAIAIVHLLRDEPPYLKALALAMAFLQWVTQPVMAWVYMEPMMLAFFLAGLCFYRRVWIDGSTRHAAYAGVFFGLAIATRQNAMFYLPFVAVHGGGTVLWEWRRGERDVRALVRQYALMFGVAVLVAAPFLGYLLHTTGTIGYADIRLPGMSPALATDPAAIDYLRSFTVPLHGPVDWARQYWYWTLITGRWQVGALEYIPLIFFVIGIARLAQRGDRASLFLASYVPVHVVGEMFQLMTVHGNWRYIIASRVLFAVVVAIGVWYFVGWVYRTAQTRAHWDPVVAGVVAVTMTLATIAPGFVTPGLVSYLWHQDDDRAEKGQSFKELGEFVQTHVPEDALILSGRWYTTGYYLHRNYTWVSYYGNTWVIDTISDRDPATVRDLLKQYGIDYIVFQAPVPSYLDAMPSGGLRTIVLDDLDHFQLLYRNERTRLYRFWPDGNTEVKGADR